MYKVLIVDDHPLIRAGAATFLRESGDIKVVGETNTVEEGFDLAVTHSPDLVWLDIQLQGKQRGLDLARVLRDQLPETKVMVITNYCNEPYVKAAMECGVRGYILKQAAPHEILEAIHVILGGGTVFSSLVTERLLDGYLGWHGGNVRGGLSLTNRELEVLSLVADGLENRQVSEELAISVKAVEGFLRSIYAKLSVSGRLEAVIQAVKKGLIVLEPESAGQK